MSEHTGGKPVPVYGDGVLRSRDKVLVQTMANAVGVSFSALMNRMRTLGRLEYLDIAAYLDSEMNFGGVE